MQKLKTMFRNGSIALAGAVVAAPSFAAVDTAAVTTAINGAGTQAEGVGGTVIAVVASLVVIGIIIAIVKKV